MLRITKTETKETISLKLEGKLAGAWVSELELAYADSKRHLHGRGMAVDMNGLTGTDAAGRYLLMVMQREGTGLHNAGLFYPSIAAAPESGWPAAEVA